MVEFGFAVSIFQKLKDFEGGRLLRKKGFTGTEHQNRVVFEHS